MSEVAAPPHSETITVPASQLVMSEDNVRNNRPPRNIEALADSIFAQGLLQNLVVSCLGESYPVEAGERRRLAIVHLVAEGRIPPDWPVPVRIVEKSGSTAASLTENFHREVMHPADEVAAFHALTVEGWTIDKIADAFGVTPLVVERRLSLARAAPSLVELFRNGEITTEQMMALCTTDNHERQEAAWRIADWNRTPATLRRLVVAEEVEASNDPRVAFIGGVAAYVAAGGDVRPDLFSTQAEGGFIVDVGLLEQLVEEKLDRAAVEVRGEGWGWVEIWPAWNWTEFNRLGRLTRTASVLSPEATARIEELGTERAVLEDQAEEFGENGDDYDELSDIERGKFDAAWARLEEIDDELTAIQRASQAFEPEAVAAAGAVVAMDGARLRIERGLVRAEDRQRVAAAVGGTQAVAGGRESQVAGRKVGTLSDPLTRSLYGHRNLAAQMETAANAHVAKVVLACWIVQTQRYRNQQVPVDLRIAEVGAGTRTQHLIADEAGAAKRKEFESIGAGLIADLPKEDEALWDTLMALPADEIDRLIAFGVASAVSLDRTHAGLTAKLLEALGFQIADHFTATSDNYLSRVSKAMIVEALAEAGKIPDETQRAALAALKKGDLAARAEADLAGSGWVPALIRAPTPKPAESATKPAKRKRRAKEGGDGDTKNPGGTERSAATGRRTRARAGAAVQPLPVGPAQEEVAPDTDRKAA